MPNGRGKGRNVAAWRGWAAGLHASGPPSATCCGQATGGGPWHGSYQPRRQACNPPHPPAPTCAVAAKPHPPAVNRPAPPRPRASLMAATRAQRTPRRNAALASLVGFAAASAVAGAYSSGCSPPNPRQALAAATAAARGAARCAAWALVALAAITTLACAVVEAVCWWETPASASLATIQAGWRPGARYVSAAEAEEKAQKDHPSPSTFPSPRETHPGARRGRSRTRHGRRAGLGASPLSPSPRRSASGATPSPGPSCASSLSPPPACGPAPSSWARSLACDQCAAAVQRALLGSGEACGVRQGDSRGT